MAPFPTNLHGFNQAFPRVRVGLVQINHSYFGQSVLPYSVALLQAYVEKHARAPDRFEFDLPIFRRQSISGIVDLLLACDAVGFSTYVWNGRISLEIARRLRERREDIVIIFGGPHVPDQAECFLIQNSFIDIAVHNEGERTFLALLEQYPNLDPSVINGISFIDAAGRFQNNPNTPRIRDLDDVPSPFLTGVFDQLIELEIKGRWIALWETNRGCPFRCTFCDWGSAIATKLNRFALERLQREIDWFSDKRIKIVYCCDANFGILKRDIEIAKYAAEKKRFTGYPKILSVQNTKNATERAYETQKILSDAALTDGIPLAIQSLDPQTLQNIKRENIALDVYDKLQHRFMKTGVDTYSDLIIGLPGETYATFVEGVNTLIKRGQHTRIRFNNLSILPNAEMADHEYREKYGIITVDSHLIILPSTRVKERDEVKEAQEIVVATASMPLSDWRRTRVFAWMTTLMYFDKLLQIPFVIAHSVGGVRYTDLIEAVIEATDAFPILCELRAFFEGEATSIQNGGPEYPYSEQWLSMYWPTDEYAFIWLVANSKLNAFYDEAQTLLTQFLVSRDCAEALPALADAFMLNRTLIKQPFIYEDVVVTSEHNILAVYGSILAGRSTILERLRTTTHILRSEEKYSDFQHWCREVVARGKQKGSYFHRWKTEEYASSQCRGNELQHSEWDIHV